MNYEQLKAKRSAILEAAAKHGAYNIRVFGSVARGEADENSDVDFLVNFYHHQQEMHILKFLGRVLLECVIS